MLSHCESPYFSIGLGYVGPTDACLTLSFLGKTKEYYIESPAWHILGMFWDIPKQAAPLIPKDSRDGRLLSIVWKHMDRDTRE